MTEEHHPFAARKTTEIRSRWWSEWVGDLIWGGLEALNLSLNVRNIREEHSSVYRSPFIVALWHNRTAIPCHVWKLSNLPLSMCVLTSASKDGALVAAICHRYGIDSVRGSSGRRGARAYVELLRKVNAGNVSLCFTPDGPSGPLYSIHPGIIKIASQTGLPIVPVCIDFSSYWQINRAWDHFVIPKPGSDVTLLWRKRIFVPEDVTDDQCLEYADLLKENLSIGRPDFEPIKE